MSDMRSHSEKERMVLYRRIVKDIGAVEKRHGAEEVRWAINRLTEERRERRKLEAERKNAEERLAALDKKLAS